LVTINSQALSKLRGEDYTTAQILAGRGQGGPCEASVCPMASAGPFVLGGSSVASFEFAVSALTYSTSHLTPITHFGHYSFLKNLSHVVYRDSACLSTEHMIN